MPDVEDLGISNRAARILASNGIGTVDALVELNERQLLGLQGFGPGCLRELHVALTSAGLELAEDPYASYSCAREGRIARDAGLSNLFLCDDCATTWQATAFAGEPPAYVGEALRGFCLNCNVERSDVRLRQWFLCGICDRVARSIGRSVVAERFISEEWERLLLPRAPTLELRSTDEPTLRYWDREAATDRRAEIDFAIRDSQRGEDVFGLEMKTGKGYVSGAAGVGVRIPRFQLDTSDCDAITAVIEREAIPVYLLHVQVIDRAHPPTLEYRALGAWWTDVFRMNEYFSHVDRRPRENRNAAYFDPAMFEPLETFVEHVDSGGLERLVERVEREGTPALYSV